MNAGDDFSYCDEATFVELVFGEGAPYKSAAEFRCLLFVWSVADRT